MSDLITSSEQATPEWLTNALHQAGVLSQGRVLAVTPQSSPSALSRIIPLVLQYDEAVSPDIPSRFILKMSGDHVWPGPNQEIWFYQTLGSRMDLPVIRCFDAAEDPETGRFHLLLEDLSSTHTAYPPSQLPPHQWETEQIVDALADIHAYWWDSDQLGSTIGERPTAARIREGLSTLEGQYYEFAEYLGDRLPVVWRNIYIRLFAALPDLLVKRFAGGSNLTLIHGDPHVGNFLYPKDPEQHRLRVLDWKSFQVEMGVDDMAHMMAMFWFSERRARLEQPMLRRYYRRLVAGGVKGYAWEDCARDYRLAVLGHMLSPIWKWRHGTPVDIWWNHLNRLFAAFFELGCNALLER